LIKAQKHHIDLAKSTIFAYFVDCMFYNDWYLKAFSGFKTFEISDK